MTHPVPIDLQLHWQTHVADLAVEEAVLASDPTDSAPVAMVLVLVLVIEQVADEASVLEGGEEKAKKYQLHRTTMCEQK